MVWLPVLQLLKAEDAYVLRGATFGSQFQSPSLGSSGVREEKQVADNINFPSSIHPSIYIII